MTAPTLEPEIEALLAGLNSEDANRRQKVTERLTGPQLDNERIRAALEHLAAADPSWYVRTVASQTLKSPAKPVKKLSPRRKTLEFAIGFAGWWVVNASVWWLFTHYVPPDPQGEVFFIFGGLLVTPANLFILVILAFMRRWVALGVVATYAVNFLIAATVGMTQNAMCWFPYYVSWH